jgi:radical SAM superfamily enzyme YgiQ (UPF0313 family)
MLENKIILVDPLLRKKYDGLYDDFGKQYDVPYGLLAIGSHLEAQGVDSKIVSMDYETDSKKLSDEDVLKQYLRDNNPKVVGFTSYTLQYEDAKRLARSVREYDPNIQIVIGGHHTMHQPEEVLNAGLFDAVVIGEGEETFEEYVNNVFNETQIDSVSGIAYKTKEGVVKRNNPRMRLQGDVIITPNYALLPDGLVKDANIEVMTSRGCCFDCSFCSSSAQYGRKVETRSLDSVREEITALVEQYGQKEIGILDETLHARSDFNEFMEVLKELNRELGVTYLAQTRADAVLRNPESLSRMKESGIVSLVIGAESGSDSVLKWMNKRSNYENVPKALELIKNSGIGTGTFWIVGHPGSSYEEEMKTKDAIENLLHRDLSDYTEVNVFMPYEGTRAAKLVTIRTKNTSDYNRSEEPVHDLDGFQREQIKQAYLEIISVLKKYGRKNGEVKK